MLYEFFPLKFYSLATRINFNSAVSQGRLLKILAWGVVDLINALARIKNSLGYNCYIACADREASNLKG